MMSMSMDLLTPYVVRPYLMQGADTKWRYIMKGVERTPEILQYTDTEGLLSDLQACNASFNVIEKSLNAYLDSKKLVFPR